MATAGELQSTQEAPLPTPHQQDALMPGERSADEGMDGEREELRVKKWVGDEIKERSTLSVCPARTCCFGGPPCKLPELNYSQQDRVYKSRMAKLEAPS